MRVAFTTHGCKVNFYDTENLSELFAAEGFTVVGEREEADIYLVNSCTVTSSGDRKSLRSLRKMRREHPDAVIALTGCYPQAFPDEAALVMEADIVTGTKNRRKIIPLIKKFLETKERIVEIESYERQEPFEQMNINSLRGRTRAFLKIEDGCERYCSYCIIPTARGPVRSKPLCELEREVQGLAENGYKEVVLAGINLPSYGKDLGLRLIDAVEAAAKVPGIERIRLGSLEPELLSDEDIARMAAIPQFCPQFHLALQSGCDNTLKAMNRHYDTAEYRRIANRIREVFENPSLTTDVMVGFPGETEDDHKASLAFVEEMGFMKAHVFEYSVREGTAAAKRPNQVPPQLKDKRSKEMIEVSDRTRQAFLESQVGRVEEVLMETTRDPFGLQGFTKNYTPVSVDCGDEMNGRLLKVRLTAVLGDRCIGVIEE